MTGSELRMVVAERVRALRLAQGLTWETLASKAHVSVATVARLERGTNLHRSTFRLIAEALGTTPEALVNGDDVAA